MITDIRPYFNTQIISIDPLLTEWDEDPFGNNDVMASEAEKYYNLVIGDTVGTRDSNNHTDSVSVALYIWTISSNNRLADYDNLYKKAGDIKNCIIKPANIYDPTYSFNDIESIGINRFEEPTSDNTYKMELLFTVRNSFKF